MSAVHVCWSRVDSEYRRVLHCPTCKRRRRFYVWAQDWYDPVATCCACGDAWSGGERLMRPACRGWRQERSAWAKRAYAAAAYQEGERA